MKPFFEAGLKELANHVGYPSASIQSRSIFKRTHHFLMEVWESMYRCLIKQYHNYRISTEQTQCPMDIAPELLSCLQQLMNRQYDDKAITCVLKSLEDELEGITEDFSDFVSHMSSMDDTWAFWYGFVFRDCMPYILLFLSIRSRKWKLRMGALKSMAANFTALTTKHIKSLFQTIQDVLCMPPKLLDFFEKGEFAVSLLGLERQYHSVGIDEAHEMLIINKHIY